MLHENSLNESTEILQDISDLKSGIPFTAVVLTCFKLHGNKKTLWRDLGLNPSRQEDLFDPSYMNLFKNQFAEKLAEKSIFLAQVMAALRHKYINDIVEKMVTTSSVKQIIILGAGFDTRAQTYKADDINYFEIDVKEILELKTSIYKKEQIDSNAIYIPIDYIEENLIARLLESGALPDKETLFIWEGNSMFIPCEQANALWNKIYDNFSCYYIIMDYCSKKFIERTTGVEEHIKLIDSFAAMNAMLINGYDDINKFCIDNKLTLIENHTIEELAKIYEVHDQEVVFMQCASLCLLNAPLHPVLNMERLDVTSHIHRPPL